MQCDATYIISGIVFPRFCVFYAYAITCALQDSQPRPQASQPNFGVMKIQHRKMRTRTAYL